jgi:hypothetical protein
MPPKIRSSSPLVFPLSCTFIAAVLAVAAGCSSSSAPAAGCTAGTTVACSCAGAETGTQLCGSAICSCGTASQADAGASTEDAGEHIGDGGRVTDGASPSTLYSACALEGSFGWPCSLANVPGADAGDQTAVLDPVDCTDPSYPYCFLGGQGSWCTAPCTLSNVSSTCTVEDAGCAPRTDTTCNAKGFCK